MIKITIEGEEFEDNKLLGQDLLGSLITIGNRQFLIIQCGFNSRRRDHEFEAIGWCRQEWLDQLKDIPEFMANVQREKFKEWKQ